MFARGKEARGVIIRFVRQEIMKFILFVFGGDKGFSFALFGRKQERIVIKLERNKNHAGGEKKDRVIGTGKELGMWY